LQLGSRDLLFCEFSDLWLVWLSEILVNLNAYHYYLNLKAEKFT
jgi:hypothetical protein